MYEEFLGLSRRPFSLTPDPEFIFWTSRHRAAAGLLEAGIRRRSPITVVTGEVGAGKTTLIRHLLESAPEDLTIGLLSNVIGEQGDLYRWILMAFGQDFAPSSRPRQVRAIQDFIIEEYAAGRATALVVDEAQNLSDDGLEALRLLSNINVGKDMLLSLVLVGQPQLRARLRRSDRRQFAQRVGATYHLGPMSVDETVAYVRHRLAIAGGSADLYDEGAIRAIHETASGVPRIVNSIADLCLVAAFGEGRRRIDTDFARSVIAEAREQGMVSALWAPDAAEEVEQPARIVATQARSRAVAAPHVVVPFGGRGATQSRPVARAAGIQGVPGAVAGGNGQRPRVAQSPDARQAVVAEPGDARTAPLAADEPTDDAAAGATVDADRHVDAGGRQDHIASAPPMLRTRAVRARRLAAGTLNGALTGALVAGCAALLLAPVLRDASTRSTAREPDAASSVDVTRGPSSPAAEALPRAAPEEVALRAAPPTPLDARTLRSMASARFIEALETAVDDPAEGAIGYAQAAVLGHERAAYYLGQMYETGDGVAIDLALARAWYDVAGELGEPLLTALPDPQVGEMTRPRPLGSEVDGNGWLELVWTSGEGADPSAYLVEVAAAPGAAAFAAERTDLSALRLAEPAGAAVWRVTALGPEGTELASDWQPLRP